MGESGLMRGTGCAIENLSFSACEKVRKVFDYSFDVFERHCALCGVSDCVWH